MRLLILALWPLGAQKFKPERVEPANPDDWNQEQEKLLNERFHNHEENVHEKVQRLVPGFDIKKLVL